MTLSEIEEKVRAFLVDELEIDPEKVVPEGLLKEDMGIDSLEVVDIAVLVEQQFGVKIKIEDFRDHRTFGDFCRFIESKIGG
ncbi:MAG: acyl carrier protein [Bacteroidales bacterium]|nr:acyl carrier protein [Bacteroidales bacterium]